jgi:hypothetical protein
MGRVPPVLAVLVLPFEQLAKAIARATYAVSMAALFARVFIKTLRE